MARLYATLLRREFPGARILNVFRIPSLISPLPPTSLLAIRPIVCQQRLPRALLLCFHQPAPRFRRLTLRCCTTAIRELALQLISPRRNSAMEVRYERLHAGRSAVHLSMLLSFFSPGSNNFRRFAARAYAFCETPNFLQYDAWP